MPSALLETLANSSAHGISRAAATQSIPLRVAWILLFLCFLGLFCKSSVPLVQKLRDVSIITDRDENRKVPFELPDLYFCALNPMSGSYPFTLNESDAGMINDEIKNLSSLYDDMEMEKSWGLRDRALLIFRSLSYGTRKLLLQRPNKFLLCREQEMVLIEFNRLCFKCVLPEYINDYFQSKGGSNFVTSFNIFTDPYYSHFTYDGHKLDPITDKQKNKSVEQNLWNFRYGIRDATQDTGYVMLIVDQNKLPSIYGKKLYLSPGKAYHVSLSMEEVEYSADLQGHKCSTDNTELEFVNLFNDSKVKYRPSYYGCLYNEYMRNLYRRKGYVTNTYPIPWDLRESPRNYNISDNKRFKNTNGTKIWERLDDKLINIISGNESKICATKVPCKYRKYSVDSWSSTDWPSFPGKFAYSIRKLISRERTPAFEELMKLAKELDSDSNHSAHKESIFYKFIRNSMLRVSIGPDSPESPNLLISRSYSVTEFLADIGGLLGLYIGCSLLTLCELIELFYQGFRVAVERSRRTAPDSKSFDGVAKCQDGEMAAVSTPAVENMA